MEEGKAVRRALYRAYRPKTFDEVVGQDAITTILKREMSAGTPSHAYLFVGSRGTGKTSCAKLVAKAVNCPNLHDGNPCGECDICRGVDDGSLLDVVEIDAASNNGVDSIRDLRDEAVFTPAVAKYRVYIIDEVHMLSTQAFNALLKTLEEPPEHVIFVLATTEVHKVLPTIISRCQRFDFRRIESDVIAKRLKTVAERESFILTDDAALMIAGLSDGGMRDALSLLDVCAANSSEVTLEVVTQAAGLVGREHLMALSDKIFSGDTAGVLETVADLTAKSLEPQRLAEQLASHFRDLMLVKTVARPEKLLSCLPSEVEILRRQGSRAALTDLLSDITVLNDASARMAKSTSKRAELELALVMITEPSVKTGMGALLARIERLEKAVRSGSSIKAEAEGEEEVPVRGSPSVSAPNVNNAREDKLPAQRKEPAKAPSDDKKTDASAIPGLFRPWPQVLEEIANSNSSLAAMMMGTKAYFDGRHVLIDIQNPILLEMLRSNEYTKTSIRQAIAAVTGRTYPIGPYRAPEKKGSDRDPLEELIASLPDDGSINIH